jgi:hypothetical protein
MSVISRRKLEAVAAQRIGIALAKIVRGRDPLEFSLFFGGENDDTIPDLLRPPQNKNTPHCATDTAWRRGQLFS